MFFRLKLNLVNMWKPIWSLRLQVSNKNSKGKALQFVRGRVINEHAGWLHFVCNREVKGNKKRSQAAAYWNQQSALSFLWVFVLDGRKTWHILVPKWLNSSFASDSQNNSTFCAKNGCVNAKNILSSPTEPSFFKHDTQISLKKLMKRGNV